MLISFIIYARMFKWDFDSGNLDLLVGSFLLGCLPSVDSVSILTLTLEANGDTIDAQKLWNCCAPF